MNLSFAGCGFLGIYHVGVVSCFKEYAPNLVKQFAGASAGALAACSILCDLPAEQMAHDTLEVSMHARNHRLGPFNPKFDVCQILTDRLNKMLPKDAYLRCRGRLHVSVTRVADGRNVILDQYDSNEELVAALICSSFIPFFSGIIPPTYRGVRYIDGCYSDNLPVLDNNTITVSPFGGDCDICPEPKDNIWFKLNIANSRMEVSPENINKLFKVLFPSHPQILSNLCQQGFNDAVRFLRKNKLMRCERCLSNSYPTVLSRNYNADSESGDSSSDVEDCCKDCELRKEGHVIRLPEVVVKVFQEVCERMNQGFINWFYSLRPVKFLSVLSTPYIVSFDFAYVAILRLFDLTPKFKMDFNNIIAGLLNYVQNILKKINENRHFYSAKMTCQLAMTEISCETKSTSKIEPNSSQVIEPSQLIRKEVETATTYERIMSRMNFDISVDINQSNGQQGNLLWEVDNLGCDEIDIVEVMRSHDALLSHYYLNDRQTPTRKEEALAEATSGSKPLKESGSENHSTRIANFSTASSVSLNIEP